ncbi:MAG: T6SS effector amidase Tae4 family protein [Hyphomicrobiaceae bacterium]
MADPDFRDLWQNHPTNLSNQLPCRRSNGVPSYSNQCAVRMGECLRLAGVQPGVIRGPITCGVHPSEDMHFIRAQEFANALGRANVPWLGSTQKLTGKDPADFANVIFGKRGMIV